MLGMAFQIAKEQGLEETFKMFLSMAPEPPALVDVQEEFHTVVCGDHLVYKTETGWNIHFYVMDNLGDGRLKVCGYFLEGNDNLLIEEELIFKPGQTQKIKVEERILCKPNVAQKLKKKFYEQTSSLHDEKHHIDVFRKERNSYDFLSNNSEHFINFVKVGEAKCQVTQEIECFIRKHIFVQAIQTKPVKVGTTDKNWAAVLGMLCEIILNSSDVKPSIQETLRDTLMKLPRATSQTEASGYIAKERPKGTAVQAMNFTAKEYVNGGGRATAIQATKCSSEEITEVEGISTLVGSRKSVTKKTIEIGRKANVCAIQAKKLECTAKKVVSEGGKIISDQIAKGASTKVLTSGRKHTTKKVVKVAGTAIIVQISTAKEIEKEAGRSTNTKGTRSRAKVMVKTGRYTTMKAAKCVHQDPVRKEGEATAAVLVEKKVGKVSYAVQSKQSLNKKVFKEEEITMVQAMKSLIAEEATKEGEKAATPNGITEAKRKIITNQPTNMVVEEIVKEGEEVTTNQATNEATITGQIVVQKEEDSLIQRIENSLTDDVAKEGKKATAVQATKSAATAAIQGVSKEALKHGTRHTTTFVAKNAAATAIKHTANATVVAGLVVEGAIYSANMGKAIYEYSKGEMGDEEFVDYAVEQTATSGGSTAGGISGSLAGIAAGAAIGSVIPVIGTVIGGTIGGFAGGISGGIGGTLLGKEIGKLINLERKKTAEDVGQMNAE